MNAMELTIVLDAKLETQGTEHVKKIGKYETFFPFYNQ